MPCCGGSENISSADDVKKYGEARPFDPNFKGPIKKRSCTDVVCCILFVIFLAGMIAVSLVGKSILHRGHLESKCWRTRTL
ncbi:choline transporter protein 2 isoform X1 [Biomphalaria glabrata]|nr:choline transporter protein 2 isoform X1 [Biomphalaria glabrata]